MDTGSCNLQRCVRVAYIGHEMQDILTCIRTTRISKKARCLTDYKDGASDQILS